WAAAGFTTCGCGNAVNTGGLGAPGFSTCGSLSSAAAPLPCGDAWNTGEGGGCVGDTGPLGGALVAVVAARAAATVGITRMRSNLERFGIVAGRGAARYPLSGRIRISSA